MGRSWRGMFFKLTWQMHLMCQVSSGQLVISVGDVCGTAKMWWQCFGSGCPLAPGCLVLWEGEPKWRSAFPKRWSPRAPVRLLLSEKSLLFLCQVFSPWILGKFWLNCVRIFLYCQKSLNPSLQSGPVKWLETGLALRADKLARQEKEPAGRFLGLFLKCIKTC